MTKFNSIASPMCVLVCRALHAAAMVFIWISVAADLQDAGTWLTRLHAGQSLQLFDTIGPGRFLGRFIAEFFWSVLFLPVIEETGRDIMPSTDPGSGGGLAQDLLDNRAFQFWRKALLVSHDKILSPHPGSKILSSL